MCAQYARETDQLNRINRNEGRQKLFSLDPETQVYFFTTPLRCDIFSLGSLTINSQNMYTICH